MWQNLEQSLTRYRELEQQMSDPAVIADRNRYTQAAKEHGTLAKLVKPYLEFQKVSADVAQAETLAAAESDPEMRKYAEEELIGLRDRKKTLGDKLEELLLVEPGEDFSSLIMEIRAGTGGAEAALFAGDLYGMYTRYARDQGWRVEDISFSPGEQGGYKEVIFSITGDDVFRNLRYEGGGHRVQRVPKTETQGRIHTSLVTVAVLPEPDEVQIEIRDQDLEWERMRAGGAGGQHVNKTESAVRIRHIPTGLEVKCQDERSQHKNRERAMRILRSRLYEMQQQKIHRERAEQRRTLIGSGDRSDRIRTYNFPQNRLTDHRINLTLYKLDNIVAGNMGELIQALKDFDRRQKLGQVTNGKNE
jgi:peptide chain release factor 1